MAQQTICPACGAPLEYSGPEDVVSCGFCNTELRVVREDDQMYFQVLSQPGPQKEVLSTPVDLPVAQPPLEGPVVGEPPTAEPIEQGAVIFGLPEEQATVRSAPEFSATPPAYTPPPEPSIGAQVYQPSAQTSVPAQSSGSSRNWILIALGIVGGVCLLCLCIGVVLALVFNAVPTSF